jgi:hypothetical protein
MPQMTFQTFGIGVLSDYFPAKSPILLRASVYWMNGPNLWKVFSLIFLEYVG